MHHFGSLESPLIVRRFYDVSSSIPRSASDAAPFDPLNSSAPDSESPQKRKKARVHFETSSEKLTIGMLHNIPRTSLHRDSSTGVNSYCSSLSLFSSRNLLQATPPLCVCVSCVWLSVEVRRNIGQHPEASDVAVDDAVIFVTPLGSACLTDLLAWLGEPPSLRHRSRVILAFPGSVFSFIELTLQASASLHRPEKLASGWSSVLFGSFPIHLFVVVSLLFSFPLYESKGCIPFPLPPLPATPLDRIP